MGNYRGGNARNIAYVPCPLGTSDAAPIHARHVRSGTQPCTAAHSREAYAQNRRVGISGGARTFGCVRYGTVRYANIYCAPRIRLIKSSGSPSGCSFFFSLISPSTLSIASMLREATGVSLFISRLLPYRKLPGVRCTYVIIGLVR